MQVKSVSLKYDAVSGHYRFFFFSIFSVIDLGFLLAFIFCPFIICLQAEWTRKSTQQQVIKKRYMCIPIVILFWWRALCPSKLLLVHPSGVWVIYVRLRKTWRFAIQGRVFDFSSLI